MAMVTDGRAREIEGTITLEDGSTSKFRIFEDGGWQQGDADRERLGRSVGILDALVRGVLEDNLIVSASDPDPDPDPEDEDEDDRGDG